MRSLHVRLSSPLLAATLLVVTACGESAAQSLALRPYGVAQGLAQATVTSVFQDSRGLMWFGTREGLSRFDGARFHNYGAADGLGHYRIDAIAEDRRGRIWVALNGGGLARLLDESEDAQPAPQGGSPASSARPKFVRYAVPGPSDQAPYALVFGPDGSLWCAIRGGVYRAPPGADGAPELTRVAALDERGEGWDYSLADSRGRVWFGSGSEVVVFEGGAHRRYGAADGVGRAHIRGFAEDAAGRVLVVNRWELYAFEGEGVGGRWERLPVAAGPGEEFYALAASPDGSVWAGTEHFIYSYRGGAAAAHGAAVKPGLIRHLTVDRDGNLWVGTNGAGVFLSHKSAATAYTRGDGSPLGDVRRVVEGADGRVYASVGGAGLYEIAGGAVRLVPGSDRAPFASVLQRFMQDGRGDWWVQTNASVHHARGPRLLLGGARSFPRGDGVAPDYGEANFGLFEDSRGRVWSVRQSRHVVRYVRAADGFAEERVPLPEFLSPLMGVAEDRSGAFWLNSHGGFARLRPGGEIERLAPAPGLPDVRVRALFVDSRGWLWIATAADGVSVTRDPAAAAPVFENYSTPEGLASNSVASIAEGPDGRIYLGTRRGLDQLDPATGRVLHLGDALGLEGAQVNCVTVDRRGFVWVGTSEGLTRLDPAALLRPGGSPPPVYLTRARAGGGPLPLPELGTTRLAGVTLPHARNNLLVEFAGVSFVGGGPLRYQSMLEGLDPSWGQPAAAQSVNYASLAPGRYRFLVRAVDALGRVSAEPAAFEFRVEPPFWLRWQTRVAALLALAALAALAYRARLRRVRREFALVLEERARIAREIHDTLAQGFAGISVQLEGADETLSEDPAAARHHLDRARQLARASLAEARRSVRGLRLKALETGTLAEALGELARQMTGETAVTFRESGRARRRLPRDAEDHLLRIAQESVTNALRHAAAGRVEIALEHGAASVRLVVRDDGRGIAPHALEFGGGYGLTGMRERARRLGARLDVYADGGTVVSVEVPAR